MPSGEMKCYRVTMQAGESHKVFPIVVARDKLTATLRAERLAESMFRGTASVVGVAYIHTGRPSGYHLLDTRPGPRRS